MRKLSGCYKDLEEVVKVDLCVNCVRCIGVDENINARPLALGANQMGFPGMRSETLPVDDIKIDSHS